ncbi:MAG: polyprenyl diphosphate synthase [Dehalococcoidales bacterium]|nr:polyprenyl diphosphate synthase [Dehalococcoidales bacterium]MDZ4230782.1 polyprenyl diphosphate synthase [Dehalococcoidales bacterium]
MTRPSTTRKFTLLPTHIAFVPDGNGRWAEKRGLPRLQGHSAGVENMRRIVEYLNTYAIKFITLYGFSTENWSRPAEEVNGLFRLLDDFIDKCVFDLHKNGVKLRHLGRLAELPPGLQQAIKESVELTRNNTGMTLSLAFNYGGRAEILDAARRLITDGVAPQDITEELFSTYLYTNGLPNVDLLIRTGDELRLSNFLIWQTAYSEYHFTKVLWPDFGKKDMDRALLSYSRRQRRFGGL